MNPTIAAPDPDIDVLPPTKVEPASWKGRTANRMRPSSREIKLLFPKCNECAAEVGGKKYLAWNWQDSCPHDPYVSLTERPVTKPIYEDVMETVTTTHIERVPVLDEEGVQRKHTNGRPMFEDVQTETTEERPTGAKRVVGTETIVEYEPVPNWTQRTHAGGVNKGRGVEKALRRGCIFPQMLRSPIWPNGIKRRCQFRECFAEDLKRYANGWFCRPEEAALVRISDSSETYQVDFDARSAQFQKDQIEAAMAQVAAR
jgi:hypothetical protein